MRTAHRSRESNCAKCGLLIAVQNRTVHCICSAHPTFPNVNCQGYSKTRAKPNNAELFNPFSMKKVVAVFPENSKQNKTMRNSSNPPFRCQNAEPGDWNIKQRTARPHRPPRFELFQYRPMNIISCNQRLWRIPFISARREVIRKQSTVKAKIGGGRFTNEQTTQNVLARSIGLGNSVLDFPPSGLWEAIATGERSRDEIQQFVVLICGDMLRDRIHEKSLSW